MARYISQHTLACLTRQGAEELGKRIAAATAVTAKRVMVNMQEGKMMAEFEAARCYSEYGYNVERDCWWSRDRQGRNFRFEVRPVTAAGVAA